MCLIKNKNLKILLLIQIDLYYINILLTLKKFGEYKYNFDIGVVIVFQAHNQKNFEKAQKNN